ncbi:MAG: hypothetical protein JNL54_12330 [Kineosporiaceae bacterium]|nr:hypothetical protein [Kineosporiaceae bacterium]
MSERLQARLAELRREYELGQRRLQELMGQEVTLRETLLRISGAIQVLEEMSGTPDAPSSATGGATAATGGVPGTPVEGMPVSSRP